MDEHGPFSAVSCTTGNLELRTSLELNIRIWRTRFVILKPAETDIDAQTVSYIKH